MAGNFRFVGKVELNSLDSKVPFMREGTTKSGAPYMSFNMAVVAADKSNRAFVETFGTKKSEIKTRDVDGNDISIKWDDREDPDVVKKVAYYKRYIIELDGTRHEFIGDYDFVQFLVKNADAIKGKTFMVRGQIKPSVYNGKISLRYNFGSMIEVTPESEIQPGFTINAPFYYRAEDIDTADWDAEKVINVNAYTSQYIDKDTGNKYVETPFVIDVSKADLTNEKVVKQLAFRLGLLGMELKDGAIKVKIKKETVVSVPVECNYINGSEEVEFDENELTETQKMAIEFGINTIDDFKPKGNIWGAKKTIFKYKGSTLTGDYADGCKTEDISKADFEELIWKNAEAEETTKDLDKKVEEAAKADDIDSLFS